MTYDFHGPWDGSTGENSPLFSSGSTLSVVSYAMNYWKNNGAPAEKLLVGFPTYGKTFTLQSPSNHGIGAPSSGPGPAGPYTREAGLLAYYEICTFLSSGATQAWDASEDVPYAYKGSEWVGYDNVKSFELKVWGQRGRAGIGALKLPTGSFCLYLSGKKPQTFPGKPTREQGELCDSSSRTRGLPQGGKAAEPEAVPSTDSQFPSQGQHSSPRDPSSCCSHPLGTCPWGPASSSSDPGAAGKSLGNLPAQLCLFFQEQGGNAGGAGGTRGNTDPSPGESWSCQPQAGKSQS
uniref:GH18 domain-containing protein n=1 Tax=Zosterops lateralis melanops TaxID=1220523 RepID=A0A8D2P783_ZOSLA